jgi:uncharacterized protein YndB with AHSA1/START domain
MEHGSIERHLHINATPDIVYEVISSPEHLQQWFPDEAHLDPTPGAVGEFSWGDRTSPDAHIAAITVVHAQPPHRFAFRWVYPDGEPATDTNSLLVTFDLTPSGAGTAVRLTETGFREKGWEAAVLEQQYQEHCQGWDTQFPRLAQYVHRLVATP